MASSNPSHLVSEVGSSVAVDSGDPRCMSYTRSGRRYKGSVEMSEETVQTGTAAEAGRTGTVDVQQVLQMLLEDRRQREEETERRLREMQQHVDSLLRVVEKTTSGSGLGAGGSHESEAKVSKLTEADDIEAYLTTFERLMGAFSVPKERWVFKLAPQLTGKAQQAYAALDLDKTTDYDQVKSAILKRYNVTEETYRTRLRAQTRGKQESYAEMATRVMDLTRKWTRRCAADADAVREVIAVEQLLNSMPVAVRVWVAERKPQTVAEAGKLADDYMEARGSVEGSKQLDSQDGPKGAGARQCHRCHKFGHLARDCTQRATPAQVTPTVPSPGVEARMERNGPRCYSCGQRGHLANKCPSKPAMFCGQGTDPRPELVCCGTVEGKPIDRILLDTGAATTLVHRDLVPANKILPRTIDIRCAHGDVTCYPMAEVSMRVGGFAFSVQAAVSQNLPVPVLLGRDVPHLIRLLEIAKEDADNPDSEPAVVAVVTRGQKKREELAELERVRREEKSAAQPSPVEEDEWPFTGLDDALFQASRNRPHKTRRQKRAERQRRAEVMRDELDHPLNITRQELKELQEGDESLRPAWEQARTVSLGEGNMFFVREGLLYRRWSPVGAGEDRGVEQLVLPQQCRESVLRLAHSIPLAGHLGKRKTADRILQRFYWPTLFKEVDVYCRSCPECQKTAPGRGHRAPLIPLPIIDEPFRRIAMDIVGPLPKSRAGHRYILVICDYATRYPEAVALRSIDAEHVAEELMKVFARVGIPQEVLTDQGSNFTSQLLREVYRLLQVQPIRTSPYHPQTDGLVERFNQTLKAMLRRAATEEGRDWDKLIPYLLFAYREVPQASTGFSPFELLYGRAVRGPLDILKEMWEASNRSNESVVSYVLTIQERLARMSELARENLARAQQQQKRWYDQNARERVLVAGDHVLVLLPTATNKLLAKWQGPYPVLRKVGPVTYEVDMYDHSKRRRIFHVNMLRKWHPPTAASYWADSEGPEGDEDDVVLWRGDEGTSGPVIGQQLDEGQRGGLEDLLERFNDVLQNSPGRTNLAEHAIRTGTAHPVRLPPYRVPHAYRSEVKRQVNEMLQDGVIEPSNSEWAAPIVLVKKKDGTLRFCVDYRKLNAQSNVDPYPMPRVDELVDRLGSARYLTTLDLAKGYWQVPMAEGSREKTAFITPQGLFQFTVMPFGLQGAPATFQRMMDRLVSSMAEFCVAYLDDLVIFSSSWEEHLSHISHVLTALRDAGLTAKPSKCQFGMDQCVYLGHVVGNGQVQPEINKVEAVQRWPVPTTKKQVRAFLGLTGYYRKFIPQYATVAAPLTDLTRKFAPNSITWSDACDQAFRTLKSLLCCSPVLFSPDQEKEFILQTDASDRGVGAVLTQREDNGKEHPVAYFSRKFLPREERYSTVEKECLAIKLGVQAFRVYLLGRPFCIQTDHQCLVWLDRLKDSNTRLARWSLALQPYQYTVMHRPGKANDNADALSRVDPPRQTAVSQEKGGGV